MAKLKFKPDSSFFRKISIGAVGARAVAADLEQKGHQVRELERGSMDTKLWKEVKRKRVRIPDLVCLRCGVRIESRAKAKPELSMSHSATDDTRAWDFGMVDEDWVAFPVCVPQAEEYWSRGRLLSRASYWNERSWVDWAVNSHINYFPVAAFRGTPPARSATKGVTEGSETSIAWDATFSTRSGVVERISNETIPIRRSSDGHLYKWKIRPGQTIRVLDGQSVNENQVIASAVAPVASQSLQCTQSLTPERIERLLVSRQRTQRFTGVKLARLLEMPEFANSMDSILVDPEEDVYVRLEAGAYLAATCGHPITPLFGPFYKDYDEQTRLEAVIATGEAGTEDAVQILCQILDSPQNPYFLRSAAAWCLGRIGSEESVRRLIRAFGDVDPNIREEALEGIVMLGGPAVPRLLEGISESDGDVAAGCAESLRQQWPLGGDFVDRVIRMLQQDEPPLWSVWLAGNLPRNLVAARIAALQDSAPQLHYALSILWSFMESWIARRWELNSWAGAGTGNDH